MAKTTSAPLTRATQKEWLAVAGRQDPGDLERLLASLWDTTPAHARGRLAALARWPADARTAAALATFVGQPSIDRISPLWREVYVDAVDVLGRLGDGRAAAAIAFVAGVDRPPREPSRSWDGPPRP